VRQPVGFATAAAVASGARLMVLETAFSTWRWKAACIRTWCSTPPQRWWGKDAGLPPGGQRETVPPGGQHPRSHSCSLSSLSAILPKTADGPRRTPLLPEPGGVSYRKERLDAAARAGNEADGAGGRDGGDRSVAPGRVACAAPAAPVKIGKGARFWAKDSEQATARA